VAVLVAQAGCSGEEGPKMQMAIAGAAAAALAVTTVVIGVLVGRRRKA